MGIQPVRGMPGLSTLRAAIHRTVFRGGNYDSYLPGGKIINGTLSRDPDNAGDEWNLRAGLLMGKVTTGGRYRPAVIGVVQSAYTSGGVSLTVTTGQATEIDRLITEEGSPLALVVSGPPTAGGTVAELTTNCTAANTSTGVLTISDLGADVIVESFVGRDDGSYEPITMVGDLDGYGIGLRGQGGDIVTEEPFAQMPVGGIIDTEVDETNGGLINYPTDTALQAWLKGKLSTNSGGKFIFSDQY